MLDPRDLGLPPHFEEWREGQDDIVLELMESEKPFKALVAPTGVGKSLIYMAYAKALAKMAARPIRAAVLTATKGLQDQLDMFHVAGLKTIKGRANYPCRLLIEEGEKRADCDVGPCKVGVHCDYKEVGCDYFDAYHAAVAANITNTNYAYWLYSHKYSGGLGDFDLLVCDEAHEAPEQVAGYLAVELDIHDLLRWGLPMESCDEIEGWVGWAKDLLTKIPPESGRPPIEVNIIRALKQKLEAMSRMTADGWIMEEKRAKRGVQAVMGYRFEPLWPTDYCSHLFRGIPTVLSSATVTPKTLALLGIEEGMYDWLECESPFPLEDRKVIWLNRKVDGKPVRVDRRSGNPQAWMDRIDDIIGGRLDRKGIIHAVSFSRARDIRQRSKYRRRILTHEDGRTTQETIEKFRTAPPGTVLVSPSVSTGYDFPGSQCEYQIVAKVPFPDTRSPITAARCKADKDYANYLAMTRVVQATGRAVRYVGDRCETFVIDDHWQWFSKRAAKHAPRWFRRAMVRKSSIPIPPPPLGS